jgi:hypothetical protein
MLVALALLIAASADPVAGTWEGTSLCQVRPSPCHDEHVIYRITRTATQHYRIDAYKLVAGQEQFMGPMDVIFDSAAQLAESIGSGGKTTAQLRLTLQANRLTGRMTLANGSLYRLIDVAKR